MRNADLGQRNAVPRTRRPFFVAMAGAIALVGGLVAAAPAAADEGVISPPIGLAITGDQVVGAVVSIPSSGWTPAEATLAVSWFVDDAPVTEPTGDDTDLELTVQPGWVGRTISADVEARADGYAESTTHVVAAEPVMAARFSSVPVPAISGAVRVGTKLAAKPGTWAPVATLAYEWRVSGARVSTSSTFTPTAAQRGKSLTLSVTGSRGGYASVTKTTKGVTIGYGAFSAQSAPAVSGKVRVGSKLKAKAGTWSPKATMSYMWKVSGKRVSTSSTFTPAPAQRGKLLTLSVMASRSGYTTVTRTTRSVKIGYGVFDAPTPKIKGTVRVGSTVKVSAGTWSPSATRSYRWLRNGKAIKGATKISHKITSSDWGKRLTVKVTGKRAAYTTASRTSAATAKVVKPFAKTTAPTIGGTKRVGSKLTAHRTSWSPRVTSVSWQWKRNGKAISGATHSTYKLTSADYHKKITVTLKGKRGGYVTTSRSSRATGSIAGPAPSLTRNGMYKVGSTIKAGTYYATAKSGCYWERRSRAGDSIDGVIANDFITAKGRVIVTISASDKYFSTEDCGSWTRLIKTGSLSTSFGNGFQSVGITMKSGTYRSGGSGDSCYWARLSGFGGSIDDVIDNYFGDAHSRYVEVTPRDRGFESYGCGTWHRVGD